jgi:hypothetical protein
MLHPPPLPPVVIAFVVPEAFRAGFWRSACSSIVSPARATIIFFIHSFGVKPIPLLFRSLSDLLYRPNDDGVWSSRCIAWQEKPKYSEKICRSAAVPLCPQISHYLIRTWSRSAEVGKRRLIACATSRPVAVLNEMALMCLYMKRISHSSSGGCKECHENQNTWCMVISCSHLVSNTLHVLSLCWPIQYYLKSYIILLTFLWRQFCQSVRQTNELVD